MSCDWLALSCMLGSDEPVASLPSGYRMEKQTETAVWHVREYLLDERGAKVATFLRRPKQSFLNGRRMVIEIANQWLYNYLIMNVIETCIGIYPCVVTGMPRFDLALDAEITPDTWEVIQGLVEGRIYKTSTQNGVVWWYTEGAKRVPQQLSWGATESTFHWKLYYKWRELWSDGVCAKPYIVDAWRALGMKENKVWRLEVSVSDSPRLLVQDCNEKRKIVWQDVIERRIPLFLDLYENRFVLRRSEGKSNRSRNTREYLWGLEFMQRLVTYKPPECKRATDAERRLLRKLYQEYVQRDKSAMVVGVLEEAIGRMLWERELMVMWKEMSQMTDKEIHMRFPLSLKSPQRSEDIKQYMIDFGEIQYKHDDIVDPEKAYIEGFYNKMVNDVHCGGAPQAARPPEPPLLPEPTRG